MTRREAYRRHREQAEVWERKGSTCVAREHRRECRRIIICAVAPWAVAVGVFVALYWGLV